MYILINYTCRNDGLYVRQQYLRPIIMFYNNLVLVKIIIIVNITYTHNDNY